MALIRYNDPFRELEAMQDRLNSLFNEPAFTTSQTGLTTPAADVYVDEDKNNLTVEAHLPGYNEDDIEVNVDEGSLVINAEREEKQEDDKKRQYIVRESSSSYYRRIGLPKNVDSEQINAEFDNGILKVNVPFKDLPKPKSVKIEGKGKKSKKK